MDTCGNCEKHIGNLEGALEWHGTSVCRDCFEKLRAPDAKPTASVASTISNVGVAHPLAIPGYMGMLIFSVVLRVSGVLSVVASIVMSAQGAGDAMALWSKVAQAAGVLLAGLIQVAIGEGLGGLRAIAINSFHVRNQARPMTAP